MNYQNLDQEIKEYLSYFKHCDSITSKFSSFFKQFVQAGTKFISKSQKSMEEFCNEVNKVEYFPSTLNKNINSYCEEFKIILDKWQNVFTNIEKDIIIKLNEYEKNFKAGYKSALNKLNELNIYLLDNKNKLEKTKNNYFDSCKSVIDYNKKYISNKSKEVSKEEQLKYNEQFEKLKQTSETKKVYYRIEVTKLNDLLLSNENYYIEILKLISKQEEERSQFYANILLLLNNNMKQFNFETKDLITRNEKFIDDIYAKRDIKMFSLFFNKTNIHNDNIKDKSRFLYEEFFDYENINSDINLKSSNQNYELKENNENKNLTKKEKAIKDKNETSEILKIDYNLALKISEIGKEPLASFDIMDKVYIELDNIILDLFQKKEKIEDDKFLRMINTVEEKNNGCKNFIYMLMNRYTQKSIVKFNCQENIFLLNSVLNLMINYIWENDEFTYLAFFILYLGERTIFFEKDKKYSSNYLCKIMSKNTIYHINDFWYKIINLKIKMIAKIKLTEEFNKRKKISGKKETGIISKFFGVSSDDYDKIENEILYSQLYKENSPIYLNEVLTEYLNHFICYEFTEKKTIDLIELLSEQYNLNIKQKNYFVKIAKTNMIYYKNPNPYFSDSKSAKNNSNKKYKKINNNKIKIILFTIQFLDKNDIKSMLCLNKESYSIIKKYYFKNLIIKENSNIDIKKHISIWKILLGYKELKAKYDYKKLKESLTNSSTNNNKNDSKETELETIELDCVRTSFRKNQEENQNKICNILKVSTKQIPSINYCQGMNHIASFLLDLCEEDEEEAFYLYICFLLGTDYCNLIDNELTKLNSFFYCFERMLNLMFPEMYNFFINNNITGGYYLSSWFITLFTLAYDYEKEDNNKEVIIKIFDLFLFSGWKAIFKIGISLMKFNSNKIFSFPYEQLVHYLNNDLINSDFFSKGNIGEIVNLFTYFKIPNNLLNNLSEEYEMKKNILNKNNFIK